MLFFVIDSCDSFLLQLSKINPCFFPLSVQQFAWFNGLPLFRRFSSQSIWCASNPLELNGKRHLCPGSLECFRWCLKEQSFPSTHLWLVYLSTYIYMILHNIQPNVGRYAIYGCYGTFSWPKQNLFLLKGVLVGFGGWVLSCGILPKMAFLTSPAENSRFGSSSSFGRAAKSPGTNIAIKNTSWWCGTVDPRHAAPVDMENIWIYRFFRKVS